MKKKLPVLVVSNITNILHYLKTQLLKTKDDYSLQDGTWKIIISQ